MARAAGPTLDRLRQDGESFSEEIAREYYRALDRWLDELP